jgi:5'-3' exonuclease
MGIRNLNRLFKSECGDAIKQISISELSGKKIAIDISIYMYKFTTDGSLIENLYLMLSVLRHHEVIPIFIFDGKPPTEKKELLDKRKEDKVEAFDEYTRLKNLLADKPDMDENDRQEIMNAMDLLKRRFISINQATVQEVKALIRAYGATYFDAHGEADELCAQLVLKNKVWACLSEDMDMFVYGCPRVIRYLSLLKHTVVLYDLNEILKRLGLTQKQLRAICILSGTDYNLNVEHQQHTLVHTLQLFKTYQTTLKTRIVEHDEDDDNNKKTHDSIGFYIWLIQHTDYITNYALLMKIYSMFDLSIGHERLDVFNNVTIMNSNVNYKEVKNILKKEGFVFPKQPLKSNL